MHTPDPREIADHPLLIINRMLQSGELTRQEIDDEFRETISDPELLAIILDETLDDLGDNSSGEVIEMEPAAELKPLLPLPLPPKPPAAPVAEEPPLGASMRKLVEPRNPVKPPAAKPSWQVAKPSPVEDLGERQYLDW
jgi:hypothetical protein